MNEPEWLSRQFSFEQKSAKWHEERRKKFTASSNIYNIMRGANGRKQVIDEKLNGRQFFSTFHTRRGNKYETIAKQIYTYMFDTKVKDCTFVQHKEIDDIGASPDGYIEGKKELIEIKIPYKLKPGVIKKQYRLQMLTQLAVTGWKNCVFFECEIKEYRNAEEYYADGNDKFTKNALPKGLIGQIVSPDIAPKFIHYEHVPFHWTSQQQFEYLNNFKTQCAKKCIPFEINYWKLVKCRRRIYHFDNKLWQDVVKNVAICRKELKKEKQKKMIKVH